MRIFCAALALSFCVSTASARDADCTAQTAVGDFCVLPIDALRPTQSAVGFLQVADDVKSLRKKKELRKWMKKKLIPVVISPEGEFYLTDRHHTSRALWEAGEKTLLVKVIAKLDQPARFWPEMQAQHWVYLYDERGNAITPAQLPRSIAALSDDPYRALAGFAQDAGFYKKTSAYFMEFAWARYFGNAMQWQPISEVNLKQSLRTAEQLACAPAAQSLPGYFVERCAAASKAVR